MTQKMGSGQPLSLLGFASTTLLLSLVNAGILHFSITVLAMAIFYGGTAQVIGGIIQAKNGSTFHTTIFCSYGFFWLAFAMIKIGAAYGFFIPTQVEVGAWLFSWFVITAIFVVFVFAVNAHTLTKWIFVTLDLVFLGLVLEHFLNMPALGHLAGYGGIFLAFMVFYEAMAIMVNEALGHTLFPL